MSKSVSPTLFQDAKSSDVSSASAADIIAASSQEIGTGQNGVPKKMSHWHLTFIAIGGTIGTGLFLGIGSALSTGGPVGTLIAFLSMGFLVWIIMIALSEMAAYIPVTGSFSIYVTRFIDPSLGFAVGWMYWFSWSVTFALELTAAGIIIQYWDESLSIAIWISIFLVIFTLVNMLPVNIFGAVELWFSSIKVVTIVVWCFIAIAINCGAGKGGYLGFKYWTDPGPFVENQVDGAAGRFDGFWAVMITAAFAYQGTELVGLGAGDAEDPAKSIPRAVNFTFWTILGLFNFLVFFVGIVVPSNNPDLTLGTTNASASPLVIATNLAGLKVIPDIINAVLLTAVLSAANSNVYSGARILVGLAHEGQAPRFLTKKRRDVPAWAVLCTAVMGLLGYMNLSSNGEDVFNWLLNIISVAGMITWTGVCGSHIRFRKILAHRGVSLQELPYVAPGQPYLSWFGIVATTVVILTNGFQAFVEWSVESFFTAYISLILFVVLFIGHKVITRSKPVAIAEANMEIVLKDEHGRPVNSDNIDMQKV